MAVLVRCTLCAIRSFHEVHFRFSLKFRLHFFLAWLNSGCSVGPPVCGTVTITFNYNSELT